MGIKVAQPVLQEEIDHKNDQHNRNHQGHYDLFYAFRDRERLGRAIMA